MTKYEVDFDDFEDRAGYSGDQPKPGVYPADLVSFKGHTSAGGNEGFEWIFEVNGGPYQGWRGWVYSNLDAAKWKTQQILKAIQGGTEKKAVLDTSEKGAARLVKVAKPVKVRTVMEQYQEENRAKIRVVMADDGPKSKGRTEEDDSDEEEEEENDDPF